MSKLFNKIVLLAEDNKVNRIVSTNNIEVSCYEKSIPGDRCDDNLHMNFSYAPSVNPTDNHFGQSVHVWKGNRQVYSATRNLRELKENIVDRDWEKTIESLVHMTIIDKILG